MNQRDFAVQWGEAVDRGASGNRVFPFGYSFVAREDDTWDVNKTTNNLDSIGVLVGSGATVDHYVRMDPDYPFILKYVRYSVYYNSNGTYLWYEPLLAGGWEWDPFQVQQTAGTPLLNSLDISLTAHGPDGKFLYGGMNLNAVVNGLGGLLPIGPNTLQGCDYGTGQPFFEYLLPREGMLRFRITNNHAIKDLYVAGLAGGVKVVQ